MLRNSAKLDLAQLRSVRGAAGLKVQPIVARHEVPGTSQSFSSSSSSSFSAVFWRCVQVNPSLIAFTIQPSSILANRPIPNRERRRRRPRRREGLGGPRHFVPGYDRTVPPGHFATGSDSVLTFGIKVTYSIRLIRGLSQGAQAPGLRVRNILG
jgi:hypothetical protein